MTTAIRERVEIKAPATVLRRVECDERDAAILCAVLRGVRTYRALTLEMGRPANETAPVHFRVTGTDCRGAQHRGGGLMQRGLIVGGPAGTLRPGPRLAGIDHGWPLELVEVEV